MADVTCSLISNTPRVLIGFPSAGFGPDEPWSRLIQMLQNSPGCEWKWWNPWNCYVSVQRNSCVIEAKEWNATHLLFLDRDMLFPPDTLTRLLSHKKEIVGATYIKRRTPFTPLGTTLDPFEEKRSGLVRMARIPTGCLLIEISVFDSLQPPWFRMKYTPPDALNPHGVEHGEDWNFCDDVREAGHSIYCDCDLTREVQHLGDWAFSSPPEIWPIKKAEKPCVIG